MLAVQPYPSAQVDRADHDRMTGAQFAALVESAVRAQFVALRRAGLYLPRETFLSWRDECTSHVALAGLERAREVESAQGIAPMPGTGPRWAAVYATHLAPKDSPVPWTDLSADTRAQLLRDRWTGYLRNVAKRWLQARADEAQMSDGAPVEDIGEQGPSAGEMIDAATSAVDALAATLQADGRPFGAQERHALTHVLSGASHADLAAATDSTEGASRVKAHKGRAALARRFGGADGLARALAGTRAQVDRDDLRRAASMALVGQITTHTVAGTMAHLARDERASRRRSSVADVLPNVETVRSGHAGGIVRRVEDPSGRTIGTAESAGRDHLSYVVHRPGIGSAQDRRAAMLAAARTVAQDATRLALAGDDDGAQAQADRVRAILSAPLAR